uniref:Envelope glycoprotein gp160 n=1 Tax=Human immunodeficiency virus type 1 TaxID=11676 RepID=A0A0U4E7V7_HV1|nr:envelope glycoprotein [Human immunodeficiency virus 1]
MTVIMKAMERRNEKSWTWCIVMALIIPCLNCKKLYATVYSGVPVWEDAAPVLFCASDVNMTSMEKHNIWASQACVPTDPSPHEYLITNVTDNFNIWGNYMVEQMQEDIISLWDQSLKPCVEMTFLCVQMNCTDAKGSTNTTDTNTTYTNTTDTNPMKKCDFNVTTVLKDKLEKKQALFYVSDLMKLEENKTIYTLINCNSTTIRQACPKVSFEPIPIHYCAPAGYAIFKCTMKDFNGTGSCNNISVVTCTHGIKPAVSTQLILNGTLSKDNIRIMGKNISNSGKTIIVTLKKPIKLNCTREGNQETQDIGIGPLKWRSIQLIDNGTNPRAAYCNYSIAAWEEALKETAERYLKLVNNTENTTIIFNASTGGDAEITNLHFSCHGEFFYCNTSGLFNHTFECIEHNCTSKINSTHENSSQRNGTIPCRIRQVVRAWMGGRSGLYAPPIKGILTCQSNITGMLLERDEPWNQTGTNNSTFRPTGGDMRDIWRTSLYNYKVVRIKPFSVAPTKIARPVIKAPRERRAAGLGMLFLGVLSAAGSTMGAVSMTLTVQTQNVLKGIVQQQDNLLRAIQAQHHLLRLSVWGIRQLRARLLALETLMQNQQLLSLWGCQGKLICYTSVEWNNSWGGLTEDIWTNLTWQEWDQQISNISSIIYDQIQEAEIQQEKNKKALLELNEWASLWNWFDITKWLWYIKIAIIIVGALIGVRVIMVILTVVRNIRQGYQPLSLQIPVQHQQEVEAPGGTGGEGGDGGRHRLTPLPPGFLQLLYTDLRTIILWSYHLLSNLASGIQKLSSHLSLGLWTLGQRTIEACRFCGAVVQYWIQELQTSATSLLDTIAVIIANWTDGIIVGIQTLGRGILNIPRRIRQGLERSLL